MTKPGSATPPPQDIQPSLPSPQPSPQLPQPLPPPADILPPSPPTSKPENTYPSEADQTIVVERFEVVGSTVFSAEELAQTVAEFTNRSISLAEVFQARSKITELYINNGYIPHSAPATVTLQRNRYI